ncbi:MAG: TetR/AcrR family transcriptional regulator [Oscillospiraceae bacterium]|nr:TetR/AcrR family transcriptional regulator [Oscillospiraceae bacterium]
MYKQCRTEQSSKRQRELEQGLLQAMLKQQYEEISVSTLCTEIGIPRKAFYRYFSGKDGALFSMLDRALMDFEIHSTSREMYEPETPMDYMEHVFVYWTEHRGLLDALKKSNLSALLIQRALDFSQNIDAIPRFMLIRDRRLREYGTMFMVCGLMTMIVQWHNDGFTKSITEMAELTMQLLTQPLFSGKVEDI